MIHCDHCDKDFEQAAFWDHLQQEPTAYQVYLRREREKFDAETAALKKEWDDDAPAREERERKEAEARRKAEERLKDEIARRQREMVEQMALDVQNINPGTSVNSVTPVEAVAELLSGPKPPIKIKRAEQPPDPPLASYSDDENFRLYKDLPPAVVAFCRKYFVSMRVECPEFKKEKFDDFVRDNQIPVPSDFTISRPKQNLAACMYLRKPEDESEKLVLELLRPDYFEPYKRQGRVCYRVPDVGASNPHFHIVDVMLSLSLLVDEYRHAEPHVFEIKKLRQRKAA